MKLKQSLTSAVAKLIIAMKIECFRYIVSVVYILQAEIMSEF